MPDITELPPIDPDAGWGLPRVLLHGTITAAVLVAGVFVFRGIVEGQSPAPTYAATVQPPGARVFAAAVTDDQRPRTVYIVGSQEQADSLWVGLHEGDAVRYQFGLSPLREDVLVAASAAKAKALRDALVEGNRILAGFGQVDIVIDLTGASAPAL